VTPAARIAELEAALEELRQSNEELREALKRAQAELEDLRTKLGMNSLNSSLPPSRDDAAAKGKRRDKAKSAKHARRREKESRRKNRSNCTLLPDKVTSSQESYPTHCGDCGTPLRARHRLAEPERTQKYDLTCRGAT
jgi:transposase